MADLPDNLQPVVIDFETFFASKTGAKQHGIEPYTLRSMSVPEYIADPRFKIHGMAIYDDGGGRWVTGERADFAAALQGIVDDCGQEEKTPLLIMHNAYFDLAVMRWALDVSTEPFLLADTLLMANSVLGSARDGGSKANDLASLATRFGLTAKGREIEFTDGVRDLTPELSDVLGAYAQTDARITYDLFHRLLPYFPDWPTDPGIEGWLMDHTLRLYAERPLPLDQEVVDRARKLINQRHKQALDEAAKALSKFYGSQADDRQWVLDSITKTTPRFASLLAPILKEYGVALPVKARKPTATELARAAKKGEPVPEQIVQPDLAKGADGVQALLETPFQPIVDLVTARLVLTSSRTQHARVEKMARVASLAAGNMPVHLVYYGASTGRWSGGGGFNFQNLASPDRERDPGARVVAACIREAFAVDEGEVYVVVDAAQIEARVSAWLAGEQTLLAQFRNGEDVYSSFASEVFGEEVRKPREGDSPEKAQVLKLRRALGKEAVLGLGYSMGYRKFYMRAKAVPDLRPLFADGTLDEALMKSIVKTYRNKYARIVAYWEELENALHRARVGSAGKARSILFKRLKPIGGLHRPLVSAQLPSGRCLYYHDIRSEARKPDDMVPSSLGQGREWKHGVGKRLYGGLLLENVTQAASRDILAKTLVQCEQAGYPVVLHTHDEIVLRVPEKQGERALADLSRWFAEPPEWMPGVPLASEGKLAYTLGK